MLQSFWVRALLWSNISNRDTGTRCIISRTSFRQDICPRASNRDASIARLGVIFVGYCYSGKGVFELVAGCVRAAKGGLSLRLTLVGAESTDFQEYLDNCPIPAGLTIIRCGAREFDEVQSFLARQDVFCFPTRHVGEGHSNAVTEAMAHALVIVTTRHGFIPELLDEDSAYFLKSGSADEIADALVHIDTHREEARRKAANARFTVQQRFTEAIVLGQLRELYRCALGHGLEVK